MHRGKVKMKSCKEIAELESRYYKLTFFQKLEVFMHSKMCRLCRRYQKQLRLLPKIYRKRLEEIIKDEKIEQVTEKIEEEVLKKINDGKTKKKEN